MKINSKKTDDKTAKTPSAEMAVTPDVIIKYSSPVLNEDNEILAPSEREIEIVPENDYPRDTGKVYRYELRRHINLRTKRQDWEIVLDDNGQEYKKGEIGTLDEEVLIAKDKNLYEAEHRKIMERFSVQEIPDKD